MKHTIQILYHFKHAQSKITIKLEVKNFKISTLGDMLELGKHSVKQHKLISSIINKTKIDQVYVIEKIHQKKFHGLNLNKGKILI